MVEITLAVHNSHVSLRITIPKPLKLLLVNIDALIVMEIKQGEKKSKFSLLLECSVLVMFLKNQNIVNLIAFSIFEIYFSIFTYQSISFQFCIDNLTFSPLLLSLQSFVSFNFLIF